MAEGPDKGRAWFVAIAALIINMIMAGIYRAQGLLFVSFIKTYNVDRKDASMPFSTRSAIRNLLAPIVGILGQKYGAPAVTILGGVLGTISSVLCYFATDMLWINIIWGGVNGIASALITVLPSAVIGQYFVKYRTTATGLSLSGGGIGSFVFPAVLEILLHFYGLEGTFFILAGLIMHTIPAAMLLKKPSWLKNGSKQNYLPETEVLKVKTDISVIRSKDCGNHLADNSGAACRMYNNHDLYNNGNILQKEVCSKPFNSRTRSISSLSLDNSLTHQMKMNKYYCKTMNHDLKMNNIIINSYAYNIFDIDLDYLKQMSDLVFQMFSMELPNMEISYRAILLEVEQIDLWHPEKNEIMQELENIYVHIEKSLEINQISDKTIKANGLYMKRTLISGLSVSKKSESLRAVRKYLRSYTGRALHLRKNRSAPNLSNIYNELTRKDYILTKLKLLCNSNEIRIISHLFEYNPRDVLKVLFQVRSLYKFYHDLESNELGESNNFADFLTNRKDSFMTDDVPDVETSKEPGELSNSIAMHLKTALYLHKNPIFLLICFTRATFLLSFNPIMTTIVDFAMDRGFQQEDGKYIIGALSLGDLLGRLCLGWITDRGHATLPRYMLAVMVIQGVSSLVIPLMYSRWTLLPSISLFGMLQGSLFIRHPVLVAKYLSPHEQSIAVGCMDFFAGLVCLVLPVYIGYFRDVIGSYNPIFYINGVIVILAGLAWLFEPFIMKTGVKLQPQSQTKY